MNKQEIIEFLEQNLSIDIDEKLESYSQAKIIEIKLILGGKKISECSCYIERGDQQSI